MKSEKYRKISPLPGFKISIEIFTFIFNTVYAEECFFAKRVGKKRFKIYSITIISPGWIFNKETVPAFIYGEFFGILKFIHNAIVLYKSIRKAIIAFHCLNLQLLIVHHLF
ncbi:MULTISPECIES: hypothetical protein [Chryseobacterium]|uniref:hypothetical protein n=1 Tax=Chryseobacterium TaxID=59732 RepID=UPI001629DF13|nr:MULTISPECIES: hypothetical protein [Chryseobacterium]MDM1555234.1 hypothetical protein [Chryseobacterium indologenes]